MQNMEMCHKLVLNSGLLTLLASLALTLGDNTTKAVSSLLYMLIHIYKKNLQVQIMTIFDFCSEIQI